MECFVLNWSWSQGPHWNDSFLLSYGQQRKHNNAITNIFRPKDHVALSQQLSRVPSCESTRLFVKYVLQYLAMSCTEAFLPYFINVDSVPIHAFARWDARARDPWICGTMDNICIHACEAIFRIWFYFLVYWRWGVWPHTANDVITFYISILFQSLLYWCSIQKITQFLH